MPSSKMASSCNERINPSSSGLPVILLLYPPIRSGSGGSQQKFENGSFSEQNQYKPKVCYRNTGKYFHSAQHGLGLPYILFIQQPPHSQRLGYCHWLILPMRKQKQRGLVTYPKPHSHYLMDLRLRPMQFGCTLAMMLPWQ